jgi:hypothetical protein
MPATHISLEQISIPNPCPKRWDAMTGNDAVRFCDHCQKHVHNLSALTADEAQRLICQSAGALCVGYVPTAAGGVRTLDYRATPAPRFGWKLVAALGGLGAVAATVVGAFVHRTKPAPVPPPMLLGAMVAPPTTPAPAPACPTIGG